MTKRRFGQNPTFETRADSHDMVDKQVRYREIKECLRWAKFEGINGMTAKEIAVLMYKRGLIPTSERNFVSPRLTEMAEKGMVEPIGKKKCNYTGRTVTVWILLED